MNKISNYFAEHDRGWVLSLIAAACLIYLPFLGNPFFFDDLHFFAGDVMSRYAYSMFHFDLRWFPYVSLGWTAALFSDAAPHFFRLGNLLLHVANTILLFYLLRNIIATVLSISCDTPELVRGAWFAALIFAVHPVGVYAVGYVVQRSIVMATLFVLLMQMTYLKGLLSGQVRWLGLAVLFYFLAAFSKEHSVLAPVLLMALAFLLRKKNHISKQAFWLVWGAFLAIALLVTLLSRGVLSSAYEPMAAELFEQQSIVAGTPVLHILSALTQAGLFFQYLWLWLIPNVSWMSVDMREPFVSTLGDWRGWFGFAAFSVYGAVAVRLLLGGGIKGLAGFALLYPWLQFGVELAGIRVQEPFVLYRSYLWMPGLLLLIPLALLRYPKKRIWLMLMCVPVLLATLAWNRQWVFGDGFRLWNDAVAILKDEKVAGADRIYYNRGQALMAAKKWDEAAGDFERSVMISPQLAPVRQSLGDAYINAGRYQEALEQFDVEIKLQPDNGHAYFSKGVALKLLHRDSEARELMAAGCRLNDILACLVSAKTISKSSAR